MQNDDSNDVTGFVWCGNPPALHPNDSPEADCLRAYNQGYAEGLDACKPSGDGLPAA